MGNPLDTPKRRSRSMRLSADWAQTLKDWIDERWIQKGKTFAELHRVTLKRYPQEAATHRSSLDRMLAGENIEIPAFKAYLQTFVYTKILSVDEKNAILEEVSTSRASSRRGKVTEFSPVYNHDAQCSVTTVSDWRVGERLTDWIETPSGLKYRVHKMTHGQYERVDRGKCYDLAQLTTEERESVQGKLLRHPRTLDTLQSVRGIPSNRTVHEAPDGMLWVIDQWIEGETLHKRLQSSPLPFPQVLSLARQLLDILQAVHEAGVLAVRDLSPDMITLQTFSSEIYLTDFEMARLVSRESTVSGPGMRDAFWAPEIGNATDPLDEKVDVYSWAMVVYAAATKNLAPSSKAFQDWVTEQRSLFPRGCFHLLHDAGSEDFRERPTINALRRKWKLPR